MAFDDQASGVTIEGFTVENAEHEGILVEGQRQLRCRAVRQPARWRPANHRRHNFLQCGH